MFTSTTVDLGHLIGLLWTHFYAQYYNLYRNKDKFFKICKKSPNLNIYIWMHNFYEVNYKLFMNLKLVLWTGFVIWK